MRPPTLRLHADEIIVDSFAGGGGASLGIEQGVGRSPDVAINHDEEAVAMHKANHPKTRHYCGDVWSVDPVAVCGGRRVGLAWFSPDCTHHSKAKGGKPRDKKKAEKSRGLAWVVVRWARTVKPRVIFLENVEEFADWGPLLENGKPDKAKRGLTFRIWLGQLKAAGYEVEMRELRACDYGAPTTRKRLFVIARCDGQPIAWPEPTHGPGRPELYRVAAECIDWSHACPSIFGRKKDLADKTLRRIARGVMRFVVQNPTPFIVPLTHGRVNDSAPHSVEAPLRTITAAHRGELALVAPSLIQTGYGERQGQAPRALDIQAPLGTVVGCGAKHALVGAFLKRDFGQSVGAAMDAPAPTVTAGGGGHAAIVAAFMAKHYGDPERQGGGGAVIGSQMTLPIGSVTTRDHHSLVTSHMLKLRGTCADGQPIDAPSPTITASGTHLAEVRAFLTKYYGTGENQDPQLSLGTVTTHDRFGLVYVHGEPYAIADIGMRMLQPRELFRAQGFPDSYKIDPVVTVTRVTKTGKKKTRTGPLSKTAQIRMCGNSVSPMNARALVEANFAGAKAAVA